MFDTISFILFCPYIFYFVFAIYHLFCFWLYHRMCIFCSWLYHLFCSWLYHLKIVLPQPYSFCFGCIIYILFWLYHIYSVFGCIIYSVFGRIRLLLVPAAKCILCCNDPKSKCICLNLDIIKQFLGRSFTSLSCNRIHIKVRSIHNN